MGNIWGSDAEKTLKPHDQPDRPFHVVGTSGFVWDRQKHLVLVVFTVIFQVNKLRDAKSITVIRK